MKKLYSLSAILFTFCLTAQEKLSFPHGECPEYSMYGNYYRSLATKAMGSDTFEIWKSSLAVGSKTPKHSHETQEIFLLLKGEILATIGEQEVHCIAPSTLICPAHIPHQLVNIGKEPTEQIVVLGIDSKIFDIKGKEMSLPWR